MEFKLHLHKNFIFLADLKFNFKLAQIFFTEKDDICAFINTYKSKLEQTRQRIKCELQQKIRKCCMKIDRVHHSYICTFKFYLKHWHCPGDHHYVCKLSVYKNKLNQLKCQAIAKCNRAIAEILCKIKKIHDKAICP